MGVARIPPSSSTRREHSRGTVALEAMVLTQKQKGELHGAIAEYLKTEGYEEACAKFCEEAGLDESAGNTSQKLLDKKWSSVVRLQKKIMELESKSEQLETDLADRGGKKGKANSTNLPKNVAKHELSGFRGPVTHIAFNPVVPLVAASGEDGTVKVWDYERGQFERSLRGHTNAVQRLAFDPTGNVLASCSADLSIKLWDFTSYDNLKTLNGHEHNVSGICFIPPGDYLASCSRDTTIKIWETSTGFCNKTLIGHEDWVRSVIASADGKTLASCSSDQTIRLWRVASAPLCCAATRTWLRQFVMLRRLRRPPSGHRDYRGQMLRIVQRMPVRRLVGSWLPAAAIRQYACGTLQPSSAFTRCPGMTIGCDPSHFIPLDSF